LSTIDAVLLHREYEYTGSTESRRLTQTPLAGTI
jgi:hypothetical protein